MPALSSQLNFEAMPGQSVPRAMITRAEFSALGSAARDIWGLGAARDAAIVDAGSFIGASTLGLAKGLAQSPLTESERAGRIWSYDLFRAIPSMAEKTFAGENLKTGDSFRHIYDGIVRDYASYIQTFEGDIVTAPKPEGPIAVLFLDVLWNWDVTRSLAEDFYPKLEPGRSLLIHQDFVYPYYPWIIISMGQLKEVYSFSINIDASSVVFDVNKIYRSGSLDDYRNVSTASALRHYDYFIDRLQGWAKGSIGIAKGLFMAERGDIDGAVRQINEVELRYGNLPRVAQYLPNVRKHLRDAIASGVARPLGKDAVKITAA